MQKSKPKISVVVPTYNRAWILERNLKSLIRQSLNTELFEVIVVDNNSDDNTVEIVNEFIKTKPAFNIKIVSETNQGVSHARNAGASIAVGEILAFIDDDTEAKSNWLEIALKTFENYQDGKLAGLGGPLYPVFLDQKPVWFDPAYETFDWGKKIRSYRADESPYGNNMFVVKEIFEMAGGFHPDYGFVKGKLITGEEPELCYRIRQKFPHKGFLYIPELINFHFIGRKKMKLSYRLHRSYISGKTSARLKRKYLITNQTPSETLKVLPAIIDSLFRFNRYSGFKQWFYENTKRIAYFTGKFVGKYFYS